MAARLDPEQCAEVMLASGLRPLVPYPGSQVPWEAVCVKCGARVAPIFSNVRRRGSGCVACARRVGHRVPSNDPVAVMRARGGEPLEPYPGRNDGPWRVRCNTCSREVTPTYASVQQGQGPCVHCGQAASAVPRRVSKHEAVVAMREADFEPLEPYRNARARWRCHCNRCGHDVTVVYGSVKAGGRGCTGCWQPTLSQDEARARMLQAGLRPLTPYPGHNDTPWPSECLTHRIVVSTTLAHATSKGRQNGCPDCAREGRSRPRRDPESAIAAVRRANAEPLEPYPGARKKWRVRCLACGTENLVILYALESGSGACSSCAQFGFDYSAPALLYLVTHLALGAHKIGIAGVRGVDRVRRLEALRADGWQVYKTLHFEHGREARNVELSVLKWLRSELNLQPYLASGTNGWTETVDADEVSLSQIWAKAIASRREC